MSCYVLLELTAKPGTGPEVLEDLREVLPQTRDKDGCLNVDVTVNDDNPDNILLVMRWASRRHYETYRAWRDASGVVSQFAEKTVGGLSTRFFNPTSV